MKIEQKILEILHDFETFKLTDDEQGVYAKTTSYIPYIERIKALIIPNVSNRFSDPKFIDNCCISYRHDFGLLDKESQDKLRFECKEWMRAIKNNS